MVLLLLLLASDRVKYTVKDAAGKTVAMGTAAMVEAAQDRGARLQADLGPQSFSTFYPACYQLLRDTLESYGLCPQVCPLIPVFCPIYFALYTALYTENTD